MARQKIQTPSTAGSVVKVLTVQDFQFSEDQQPEVLDANFAQYVRALRQNWRQGTVGCKSRGEVAFSNKKPWKQKGTGRARVSSLRSPLWRKGGIIFGPQPRVRMLKVSKTLRKNVMHSLFWHYLNQGKIVELDWSHDLVVPKTSVAYKALKSAGLNAHKVALLVTPENSMAQASFANIYNVNVLLFDQPNAYDLSNVDYWIVLKQDRDFLKEMVNKWI